MQIWVNNQKWLCELESPLIDTLISFQQLFIFHKVIYYIYSHFFRMNSGNFS